MSKKSLLIWTLLAVWLAAAWMIAGTQAKYYEFRINNFDVLPGTGTMQRDPEGTMFHVLADGSAREVFPDLAPPTYFDQCIDCRVVREDQLAGQDEYCAVGARNTLPKIEFEVPCATSVTLDDGRAAVTTLIFSVPVILVLILLGIKRGIFKPREIDQRAGHSKFER